MWPQEAGSWAHTPNLYSPQSLTHKIVIALECALKKASLEEARLSPQPHEAHKEQEQRLRPTTWTAMWPS